MSTPGWFIRPLTLARSPAIRTFSPLFAATPLSRHLQGFRLCCWELVVAADTCQRCRWLVWSVPFVTSQEGRSAQFAKQDVIAKLNVVDCVTARKATVATNMTPREKYTDATTFCGENDDAWQENTVLHRPQEVTQRQFLGQFVQNSRECVCVSKRSPVSCDGVPKRRPQGEG